VTFLSASIVTSTRITGDLFPVSGRDFLLLSKAQAGSGPTQPRIDRVLAFIPRDKTGRSVNLTTHLHLVPRGRICEAVPVVPIVLSLIVGYLIKKMSGVDWIELAQDMYRWRALLTAVMNIRVP
jgi:hypothetical protein